MGLDVDVYFVLCISGYDLGDWAAISDGSVVWWTCDRCWVFLWRRSWRRLRRRRGSPCTRKSGGNDRFSGSTVWETCCWSQSCSGDVCRESAQVRNVAKYSLRSSHHGVSMWSLYWSLSRSTFTAYRIYQRSADLSFQCCTCVIVGEYTHRTTHIWYHFSFEEGTGGLWGVWISSEQVVCREGCIRLDSLECLDKPTPPSLFSFPHGSISSRNGSAEIIE